MKKIYLLYLITNTFLFAHSQGQTPVFTQYNESVGFGVQSTAVHSYSGWDNNGVLTFIGNATVESLDASANYPNASGGANVLLDSIPGTFLQISNFPNSIFHVMFMDFGMLNDTINPGMSNDLMLDVSFDNGTSWRTLQYYNGQGRWGHYEAGTAVDPANPNQVAEADKVIVRFTQTSSTRIIRLDDIRISFTITLPIKLNSFAAKIENSKTLIQWTAHSTIHDEQFIVEKSNDGIYFFPVGKQQAKGNGEFTYLFHDTENIGNSYYRLKMVNADGKFSYSKIVKVTSTAANAFALSVYPVPAKENLFVSILAKEKEKVNLSITNSKGEIVLRRAYLLIEGVNKIHFSLSNLPAGEYYVTAAANAKTETKKFLRIN